jgi:DNA-binding response OmpR family regulator
MSRILIVDDEANIRSLIKEILEANGYDVDEACDGNAALKSMNDVRADLVITDMLMPDKEGLETMREIRSEHPGVKIIAISGGGLIGPESYLTLAKSLGADRTFTKPFDLHDVLNAIEELVGEGK